MTLTSKQIAELVQGELAGNDQASITGIAPLHQANVQDLSFIASDKYIKILPESKAGIVLVKKGIPVQNRTVIFVEDPQFAFLKVLELFAKEKGEEPREIHPSAVIAKDAQLGSRVSVGAQAVIESDAVIQDGTIIGALCFIGKNVSIGKDCKIYPHVTICKEIQIADRVIIHSGSVIGSDGFGYATRGKTHFKIPQIGTIEIGDDVEIGANVTIDRATMGKTIIGKGTKIDNLVQIAHNVQIGEGCILVAQAGVAGSSTLGNFVTLAGQVGVSGHVTIGDGVIAAAQSGIPNDVDAGAVVFGSPARPIQQERRIQAIISKLPKIYEDFRTIKKILKLV